MMQKCPEAQNDGASFLLVTSAILSFLPRASGLGRALDAPRVSAVVAEPL